MLLRHFLAELAPENSQKWPILMIFHISSLKYSKITTFNYTNTGKGLSKMNFSHMKMLKYSCLRLSHLQCAWSRWVSHFLDRKRKIHFQFFCNSPIIVLSLFIKLFYLQALKLNDTRIYLFFNFYSWHQKTYEFYLGSIGYWTLRGNPVVLYFYSAVWLTN